MIEFKHNVPLKKTLVFEKEYHPDLALSYDSKKYYKDMGAEFIFLFIDKKLVGETIFINVDRLIEQCELVTNYADEEKYYGKNAAYIVGTTILKPYQGNGYSKLLKSYFYGYVKGKYDYVIGHAIIPKSLSLNQLFGAKAKRVIEDWYGTGDHVAFYEVKIKK